MAIKVYGEPRILRLSTTSQPSNKQNLSEGWGADKADDILFEIVGEKKLMNNIVCYKNGGYCSSW